jgi:hypothetical protein
MKGVYLPNFLYQPLPPLPVPLTAHIDSEDIGHNAVMPTFFFLPHLHIMFCHPPQKQSPSVNMPTPGLQ